jgi:transcriptional regulator GlxA family with amidase domain
VLFFERLYPHDAQVTPILHALRAAVRPDPSWLDEQLHWLLLRLLIVHRGVAREIDRLPRARPATRAEQYRRLLRGRALLEASLDRPVRLGDAARAACLAPHHFLRLFAHAFGETPHQLRLRRRLETARRLLETTDQSITTIALDVGFGCASSFGRAFRRRYGHAPQALRGTPARSK